jgi:FtsP/CotA-like multicopper oxidase with cupredoxin domain
VNRRAVLRSGTAALAAASLARCGFGADAAQLNPRLETIRAGDEAIALTAQQQDITLTGKGARLPAWIYGQRPFPILRAQKGKPLGVRLDNRLREHTSIHWHGVRGPNAMDGVPYLTQAPVQPGESFAYNFTPPDTGTFFFHPHCNTVEQLGRGLAGVLIVDGDESEAFGDDVVCVIKDWRVGGDGAFLPFLTIEGAGRAGTFGTVRTVNGVAAPVIPLLPNMHVRLRLVNVDSTRVCEVGIDGAPAQVIAIDGNPIAPFPLATWRLGPAMRLDLALRTPFPQPARVIDYFAAEPVTLATLNGPGEPQRNAPPPRPRLKPHGLPEPDLARATKHQLTLGASAVASDYPSPPPIVLPDGRRIDLADSLCLSQRTLWALDGKSWPEQGHRNLPPPLMTFARGEHVALEFFNTTPHPHPMHIHGHTMKILSCSRLARPVHWADTVLVMPNERVQTAFVADNPGNWMIHCHIIEHQDTGMMAWLKVA